MANRLAYVLRRTAAKEVHVSMEQVVELIGKEKAEELCIYCTKKQELLKGRVGPRSAIPAKKRVFNVSLACFNKNHLLEAIESAKGASFQIDGTEPKTLPMQHPDPDLTPEKHREKLKSRGLLTT